MVELNITETAVPATTRRENPYLKHVQALAADRSKALSFDVPVDKGTDPAKAVASVLNLWREAGAEVGVTVRQKTDGAHVTVWAVDRITRKTGGTAVGTNPLAGPDAGTAAL